MPLSAYLALFPGASRNRPRFMALAEALLRQATDLQALIPQLNAAFSPTEACGVQLEALAASLGLSRPSAASDDILRTFLLRKLSLWAWDGTNAGTEPVLAALPSAVQSDNQDGTVSVSSDPLPAPAADLFPVPAGIRPVTPDL